VEVVVVVVVVSESAEIVFDSLSLLAVMVAMMVAWLGAVEVLEDEEELVVVVVNDGAPIVVVVIMILSSVAVVELKSGLVSLSEKSWEALAGGAFLLLSRDLDLFLVVEFGSGWTGMGEVSPSALPFSRWDTSKFRAPKMPPLLATAGDDFDFSMWSLNERAPKSRRLLQRKSD
jgi:hypothetical protein